jgi:heme exporter protein CcmD
MIDLSAKHIGFVVGSYGIVAFVLVGLVVHIVMKSRALKKELQARGLSDLGER